MQGLMMDYPLTLTAILRRAARVFPEKEIVARLEDQSLFRYDYAAFHGRVVRLMNVLRELGVRPGDRVATFAWNGHRHLELYFAIPCLGAVLHTVNVRLSAAQIRFLVHHAEDRLLFVDRCLLDTLVPLVPELPRELRLVVLDDEGRGAEQGLEGALDYESLLAAAPDRERFPDLDEESAAGLCYTSGTTGEPKGVLYSHRSYYLHSLASTGVDSMAVGQSDVVLPVVPMFHANAWGFPFTSAMAGAKQVLPGPHLAAKPLVDLIEDERVTYAAGVPTVWSLVLGYLRKTPRDVSSLRTLIVGGSAAPPALIRAYREELGITITHAWGMTETSPVGCCSRLKSRTLELPEAEQLEVRRKQGIPVPGIEVRVEDEDGRELPWDGSSVGELAVRGPWVAKAYYRDGPGTEAFSADGWFRTGDVVTIDELGYIEIADRKRDLVKSRGEWISSVEMENAAMELEGVLEAAVTARADPLRGEAPILWVVRAEGHDPEPAALLAGLARRFARWQLPRPEDVRFLPAIPRTSVGKFDKKRLRLESAQEGGTEA